jgi:hypothetical protein
MTAWSAAMRRAWEDRRQRTPPFVTDDGFGPKAIVVDEATGCQLWQGRMNGPQPRAGYRGIMVNPCHLAYERAGHSIPDGHRLVPTCGQQRCITPDHQEARPQRRPPAPPKSRPVPETPLRKELAGRLPAERPPQIREQDWIALTAVVSGRKLAEVAVELGVSRQRVHQRMERARAKLIG